MCKESIQKALRLDVLHDEPTLRVAIPWQAMLGRGFSSRARLKKDFQEQRNLLQGQALQGVAFGEAEKLVLRHLSAYDVAELCRGSRWWYVSLNNWPRQTGGLHTTPAYLAGKIMLVEAPWLLAGSQEAGDTDGRAKNVPTWIITGNILFSGVEHLEYSQPGMIVIPSPLE